MEIQIIKRNKIKKNKIMKRVITLLSVLLFLAGQLSAQGWNYVSSTGTTFILFGMSFPPAQSATGYACGMQYTYNADGVIVKTTDGGDNWTTILPTSGAIDGLQGIWFIDDNTGFAGGWNNYFIKTVDGGTTWSPVTCGTDVWYYTDVEFWDTNNGVATGSMNNFGDQAVFITSDGGNTWISATSGIGVNSIMGLSYADQNTVFAVGTDAKVYKSTDGGHNWTVIKTLSAMLFGVDFADANFGVVGGEEKMFATSDGGATWTTYTTGYENFYGALAKTNGTAYIDGTDENIYVTTDFGATWSMEHNGAGSSSLYRIKETADGNLFTCGSQGTIINKAPVFGANFEASSDSVCIGNTIDFTDMSLGGIISWNWTFEGGTPATSTNQNPTVTYNTIGVYDVTLEVSDGTNTNTMLVEDMITVIESPIAPNEPTGITTMCAGGTEVYTTQAVASADSYYWEVSPSDAGTITGTGTEGTFISDNSWAGTYTVKVKATNMCGYGPWSNELTCTLYFNPTAFVLSEGGGYCAGGPGIEITLDGSETGVDYELFYEGTTTGTIIAGTGNPVSFGEHTDQGIYTVTGSTSTCSENMVGTPYIFVEFAPEQGNTPDGPTTACSGSTTEYTVEPLFAADTIMWSLTPSDAGVITGSGENISITWNTDFSGIASLTTQGSNDCGVGAESDPLEITISIIPTPMITGLALVCDEDEEEYSTEDNAGSTYEWTVTGGEIVGGAGTYMVTVLWGTPGMGFVSVVETAGNDCIGSSEDFEVTIDECIGIDELISSVIELYPNPAISVLNVNLTVVEGEKYTIIIHNPLGQISNTIEEAGNGMQQSLKIDTKDMKAGQYIISISTENGAVANKRFMVIK